ncbi:Phospholipid scramblase 3 [Branchiostoma belcheri]|nr:Phospholipid scramblase 3 [Branchiostoma belcheri]
MLPAILSVPEQSNCLQSSLWTKSGCALNNVMSHLQVGKISKQWSGLLKEAFTDADNLGIQFPMDLDVKVKATLLGALFLIDFMFFEQVGGEEQRSSVLF